MVDEYSATCFWCRATVRSWLLVFAREVKYVSERKQPQMGAL